MREEQAKSAPPTNVKKEEAGSSEILSISVLKEERVARTRSLIDSGQDEGGVHQAIAPDTPSSGSLLTAQSKQGVFDRLAALPMEMQAQVVGSALAAYEEEWRREKFAMMLGLLSGGAFEQAKLAQETLLTLGEVRRFCLSKAPLTKAQAAQSLAVILVCGVRLFSIAELARHGEYGVYFRDFLSLKMEIDKAFLEKSTEQRSALLMSEVLGETVVCFRPKKMLTAESITLALEEMGAAGSEFGSGVRSRVVEYFAQLLKELL